MQVSFDRSGHSALSPEIVGALKEVGERFGVEFSVNGGSLGADNMMFKLFAKSADKEVLEKQQREEFALYARRAGLEPDDYGLVFKSAGTPFKIIGVKPSRPRYPIQALNLHTNRLHKFAPLSDAALSAPRMERDAERAKLAAAAAIEDLQQQVASSPLADQFGSF